MTVASAVPCQVKRPARAWRAPGSPASASALHERRHGGLGVLEVDDGAVLADGLRRGAAGSGDDGDAGPQRGQRRGPEEHRAAQVGDGPGPADDRGGRLPGVGDDERHGRVAARPPSARSRASGSSARAST